MTTKRLYLTNSFLRRQQTTVLTCEVGEKGTWWVELAKTPFYPEGGGQPSDKGTIGGVPVLYVKERGEQVLHQTVAPVPVGESVEAVIDFDRRMDMMQQHTGEHILAGAAFKLFGANNVGFHLKDTTLMVDFDYPFTPEELELLEETANRWVWENHPITARILTQQEYQALPMRKKAENLEGEIRLVEVENVDVATCCGTHCAASGQVGMIKILTTERYKGGTRVEFACGGRALGDYGMKNTTVNTLSHRFSVKPGLVLEAMDKQDGEIAALRQQLASRTSQLLRRVCADLLREQGNTPVIATVQPHLGAGDAKELLGLLTAEGNRTAALLLPQGERLLYFFACGADCPLSMRALSAKAGELLGGKGGGTALLAQGSAPCTQGWEEQWNQLVAWALQSL